MLLALIALAAASDSVVFENAYVRITREGVHCAAANTAGCADRVIVARGDVVMRKGATEQRLKRGDILVFEPGESYQAPSGEYWEVAFKPDHPPVETPRESIRPAKNEIKFENARLFIFEERLAVGDTRARHSHNQRVVIQLNKTRLQQWPEGQPEILRDIEPDRPGFNPAVIHTVKNVGDQPLRGVVIEMKP
jgi:hypothetical protein